MPSLKDLKNRIDSVKSTRKITRAMQMVAAAKLRKAEEQAENARPYAERMNAVLANLAQGSKDSPTAPALLTGTGKEERYLLLVATAERGLCGAFNSSIAKLARYEANKMLQEGKTVEIITIGRKGRDQLRRGLADNLVDHVDLSEVKRVGYDHAAQIADDVLARFNRGEFDVCKIYYNTFKSVISQIPTAHQLIPATFEEPEDDDGASRRNYDYEPGEEAVLADLLPRSVATQIFTALLENAASEQGARMSAMDNATRNAGDMIDNLNLEYNRTRQATITNELIEIISGAEAL